MPKSKTPKPEPQRPLAAQAVMNVAKGEVIAGAGVYKLVAKKTAMDEADGVHLLQRADDRRAVLLRGTALDEAQLKQVLDLVNKHLVHTFGAHAALGTSLIEMYAPDGRRAPETRH